MVSRGNDDAEQILRAYYKNVYFHHGQNEKYC